jgi:hypothetical protein
LKKRRMPDLGAMWNWLRRLPAATQRTIAFGGLFLVSALITLAILLAGAERPIRQPPKQGSGEYSFQVSAAEGGLERILEDFAATRPDLSASRQRGGAAVLAGEPRRQDFLLPEPEEERPEAPYLFRPRMSSWSEEQVKRFWIPLTDIALDIVAEENDKRIEELFSGIP